MKDTAWFKEISDDEKLTYLSKLMYRHKGDKEDAKEEFGSLLKLLPVQLVFVTLKQDAVVFYEI